MTQPTPITAPDYPDVYTPDTHELISLGEIVTSLAFQPGGTLLAGIGVDLYTLSNATSQQPDSGEHVAYAHLWKIDGATQPQTHGVIGPLYPTGVDADVPQPACLRWHPSGDWLLIGHTPGHRDFHHQVNTVAAHRLGAFRLAGDGLTWQSVLAGDLLWGVAADYQMSFNAAGTHLAVCGQASAADAPGDSPQGLAGFDAATGALTLLSGFPDLDPGDDIVQAVAWHPHDDVLAALTNGGRLLFYTRTGDTLNATAASITGINSRAIAWSPGGDYLLAQHNDDAMLNTVCRGYAWPGLTDLGELDDFPNGTALAVSPDGTMVAGGPAIAATDPYSCGCGPSAYYGLTLDTITRSGNAIAGTRLMRPFTDDGTAAAGAVLAWGVVGGDVFLAAQGLNFDDSRNAFSGAAHPAGGYGLWLYRWAAGGASNLWMKMPDGSYRLVGVAGQPISMRMPDGSWRTWPGAGLPLYQKQSDGSWATVITA